MLGNILEKLQIMVVRTGVLEFVLHRLWHWDFAASGPTSLSSPNSAGG